MAGPTAGTSTATAADGQKQGTQTFAFIAMTCLFFFWGFLTVLNDILIPFLKESFELNYTQAMLVQFCFFGAYFIVSPLANKLIDKIGFQMGIVVGLLITALGCLLFYPSADLNLYVFFLASLFVLGSGITILQVAANPYVSALGSEKTAASRLNAAQFANSFGTFIGPLVGATLILGVAGAGASVVQMPYLAVAALLVFAAWVFRVIKLPKLSHVEAGNANNNDSLKIHMLFSFAIILAMAFGLPLLAGIITVAAFAFNLIRLRKYRSMVLGALAIFLYVGAEVSIGSFLVNYIKENHVFNIGEMDGGEKAFEVYAGKLVAFYWLGAMIGRFIGAILMYFVSSTKYLAVNALFAIIMIVISMNSSGDVAVNSILAVGFFNSIMFPTIFTFAVKGLGTMTSKGSSLVCQGIVGGALIPLVQGVTADSFGIQLSFIVPMLCYIYIGWYALNGASEK